MFRWCLWISFGELNSFRNFGKALKNLFYFHIFTGRIVQWWRQYLKYTPSTWSWTSVLDCEMVVWSKFDRWFCIPNFGCFHWHAVLLWKTFHVYTQQNVSLVLIWCFGIEPVRWWLVIFGWSDCKCGHSLSSHLKFEICKFESRFQSSFEKFKLHNL